MNRRLFVLAAVLAIASIAVALAADVAGKWTAQVQGRGGQTREVTFNFKTDGAKLTGTMSGPQGADLQISDGKVSGDEISFTVTQSFQGNEVKLLYKGKVSGDEIKMTREGGRGPQEFTAKRAK